MRRKERELEREKVFLLFSFDFFFNQGPRLSERFCVPFVTAILRSRGLEMKRRRLRGGLCVCVSGPAPLVTKRER